MYTYTIPMCTHKSIRMYMLQIFAHGVTSVNSSAVQNILATIVYCYHKFDKFAKLLFNNLDN